VNEKLVDILPLLVDDIPNKVKEVLVYVAGYVTLQSRDENDDATDRDYTYDEYVHHQEYFRNVNRGNLTVPVDSYVFLLCYVYVTFACLFTGGRVPCFTALQLYCERICDVYDLVEERKRQTVFRIV
jgi:hypothetical protein